ncbi:hypothetical protein ACH5RR_023611 [Cinchona calisaya]|uniref:Uncharacterized protein n=1 Tax=Cinchona calisaya TaxID=153742 RepID=A0ABD2ZC87_9GENT
MSWSNRSMNGNKDLHIETESNNLASRLNMTKNSVTKNLKGTDCIHNFQDQEAMELYLQARAKKNEIMFLHEQIGFASIKAYHVIQFFYSTFGTLNAIILPRKMMAFIYLVRNLNCGVRNIHSKENFLSWDWL